MLGIKDLIKIYGGSYSFFNTHLNNGSFNSFRSGYKYEDCPEFHQEIKNLIERIKLTKYGNIRQRNKGIYTHNM